MQVLQNELEHHSAILAEIDATRIELQTFQQKLSESLWQEQAHPAWPSTLTRDTLESLLQTLENSLKQQQLSEQRDTLAQSFSLAIRVGSLQGQDLDTQHMNNPALYVQTLLSINPGQLLDTSLHKKQSYDLFKHTQETQAQIAKTKQWIQILTEQQSQNETQLKTLKETRAQLENHLQNAATLKHPEARNYTTQFAYTHAQLEVEEASLSAKQQLLMHFLNTPK